jgi:hypothetical protein
VPSARVDRHGRSQAWLAGGGHADDWGHVDRAFILSVAYLVVVYSLAIGVALCLESLM